MYVSKETKEESEKGLLKVLKSATLKTFEEPYFYKESEISKFNFDPKALAMVRDNDVWSYLIPAESNTTENFKIFSFHFKDGLDNSGFVGWLASKIKKYWARVYLLSVDKIRKKTEFLTIGDVQLK